MQTARIFSVTLIATAFTLVFATSCKKSNSGGSSSVSATISGAAYHPATIVAAYSTDSALFEITGYTLKTGDTSGIVLLIGSAFTLNKPITDNSAVFLDYTHNNKDYWNGFTPGHLSVTVTSLDSVNHKIAGNFSGALYADWGSTDSVVVTNGSFNTSYMVQP